jgi:hypothetical protein
MKTPHKAVRKVLTRLVAIVFESTSSASFKVGYHSGHTSPKLKRGGLQPSLTLQARMSTVAALVVYFPPVALPITGNVRVARLSLVKRSAHETARPKGAQQKRIRPHLSMQLRVPLGRRNNRKFEKSL